LRRIRNSITVGAKREIGWMPIESVEGRYAWCQFVVVRLLRRWAASRTTVEASLPGLVELAAELGQPPQLAIALHSLFQLTENCLGRPLSAECCCAPKTSADERAVLRLLAAADHKPPNSDFQIPHGLPGALVWAVQAVRMALGELILPATAIPEGRCPFELGVA
jgi:hypothetical protein